MNESFTFVVLDDYGHSVEQRVCNRAEADRRFDTLSRQRGNRGVYYYAASVGGLVNSWSDV